VSSIKNLTITESFKSRNHARLLISNDTFWRSNTLDKCLKYFAKGLSGFFTSYGNTERDYFVIAINSCKYSNSILTFLRT